MKKIIFSLFFVFIFSCMPFLNIEIKEIPNKIPERIFINKDNTGFAIYSDRIYKIQDLNITKNSIQLDDDDSKYHIEPNQILYDEENDGSYILIYSRNIYENVIRIPEATGFSDFPCYMLKIPKNNSNIPRMKKVFYSSGGLFKLNKNRYGFFYEKKTKDFSEKNKIGKDYKTISLRVFDNDIVNTYEIDKIDLYENLKKYPETEFTSPTINIDEFGNGFFSYYKSNRDLVIFRIRNYKKAEEMDNNTFFKNLYQLRMLKNTLDFNGNGYILYTKHQESIFIQRLSNFKNINEFELISFVDKYLLSIDINNNGNGYILFKKISNGTENTILKKIANFKVDDNDIKVLDENDNSKNYHDASINEKGNGLIIFEDKDTNSKEYKIIKIRDYKIGK